MKESSYSLFVFEFNLENEERVKTFKTFRGREKKE